jgi:hypothetical protein
MWFGWEKEDAMLVKIQQYVVIRVRFFPASVAASRLALLQVAAVAKC